jgi:hypothetical protein
MKETLFLLFSVLYLLVFFYLLDFWNPDPGSYDSDSETHARTRYLMAQEIQKELDQ